MKKSIFLLFACMCVLAAFADGPLAETYTLTPNAAVIAASTTNSTAGTIATLWNGETPIRVWASCTGVGATTNGASAVSNIVVKLVTASGRSGVTNSFDTAVHSNIKLTIPAPGGTTPVIVSDWFVMSGVRYIAVGQVENNTLGVVSNLTINVGYPRKD